MKNKILFYIGILLIPFLNSCEEDDITVIEPPFYQASLKDEVKLKFSTSGDEATNYFQYNVDVKTGNAFWKIDNFVMDVTLELGEFSITDVSKVELYMFVEEKNGNTYNYIGGEVGKLYTTINNPSESFQVTFSKTELAELFKNDFSDGHNGDVSPDDLFELKWVVTGTDGSVLDTRVDCFGFDCTYGFGTKVAYVDTWVGEFQYNWTFVSPATVTWSWAKVGSNPTGIILFSQTDTEGQYNIDDLSAGGAYGEPSPGFVTYDADNKTLNVTSTHGYYASKWELVSVTPEVLTINWTYTYTASYGEYGTFEIIRNDGLAWPEGLTIVNN